MSDVDVLPPNSKMWDDEQRRLIDDELPGHMCLGRTSDMHVGKQLHIEVGGSIRIDNIEDEVEAITDAFDSFGIDVTIDLVGVSQSPNKKTASQAYYAKIENWDAKSHLADDY